ncbi:hypothetical protein AEGHOMDF_4725 [Methylobacterium soli]|nr:hypothetical protein AEGHOMDF_4725 [Methylobacterium soli]
MRKSFSGSAVITATGIRSIMLMRRFDAIVLAVMSVANLITPFGWPLGSRSGL